MSKYNVGDKFVVEIDDEFENPSTVKKSLYRVKGFNTLVDDNDLDKLQKYDELKERLELIDELKQVEYYRGLQDAWELARKICGDCSNKENYDGKTLGEMFGGYSHAGRLLDTHTYQEALAKIEAYEKSQIQVGDVVFNTTEDVKAIIMDDGIAEGAWQVYTENACVELWKECEFRKTDRHIDISSILEQIRENE